MKNPIDPISKMLLRKNKPVSFKYPGNEGEKKGTLKDRAIIESVRGADTIIPYWDVVDLIEFEGEKEDWIRIGYYRKSGDKLNWCSQTTIAEPRSIWVKILVSAARDKTWFRDILEDVMDELKKG